MLLSATTEFKTIFPGATLVIAISGYSGHTTTLQYKSPDTGTWVTVDGTVSTTNWGGQFTLPTRHYRILVAGGTGDLELSVTRKWK